MGASRAILQRILTGALLLGAASLAPAAQAGDIRFVWQPESGPARGTLTFIAPDVESGEPFDLSDNPWPKSFDFDTGDQTYHLAGVFLGTLTVTCSGDELDAGGVDLSAFDPPSVSGFTLPLSFASGPAFDTVDTPTGVFSGHWVRADPDPVRASFVHVATTDNISGNVTYLSHPLLDENPDAIALITHNYNPGPTSTQLFDRSAGVWYDAVAERWAIFAQDLAAIVPGTSFNVLVPGDGVERFVHYATAGNVANNWTVLDHPDLNGNPNAQLLVTQRYVATGLGGYNDRPIGVWYTGSHWAVYNEDLAPMPTDVAFNLWIPRGGFEQGVEVAAPGNTIADAFIPDLPSTNPLDDALPHFAHVYNTPGVPAKYADYFTGVGLDTLDRWGIFDEGGVGIPWDTAFYVYFPPFESAGLRHRAELENRLGSNSLIDHPFLNGNRDVLPLFTPVQGPGLDPSNFSLTRFGDRWSIIAEDGTAVALETGFNVWAPPIDRSTFVHVPEPANKVGHWSYLNSPALNDNPGAHVSMSRVDAPHDQNALPNDRIMGVFYDTSVGRWAIIDQSFLTVLNGRSVVIHVAKPGETAFVHTTQASNISGNASRIDHPALDGNPDALAIVTLLWDTSTGFGVYHDHPVALRYDPGVGRWFIANQDGTAMPPNVAFNVLVPEPDCPDADFDGRCDGVDLCPFWAQPELDLDTDGNGIGDACECGDQNRDGRVNLQDIFAINDAILNPALATPLCDTNDDGSCNLLDIFGVNDKILGMPAYCSRWPSP